MVRSRATLRATGNSNTTSGSPGAANEAQIFSPISAAVKMAGDETPGEGEVVQSINALEWSIDQGVTWHLASGENAQSIPPVGLTDTVGFRAIKSQPALPWPEGPGLLPAWTVEKQGAGTKTFNLTDEIWVGFDEFASPQAIAVTVTVECGNQLSAQISGQAAQ